MLPVVDSVEQKEKISADAVVYAAERFKRLLYQEQEAIEMSSDPDKAHDRAQERFRREGDFLMNLISEYEDSIDTAMAEIKNVKETTEKNLKIFCIEKAS